MPPDELKKLVLSLLLGQILSVLITIANTANQFHNNSGIQIASFLTMIVYASVALLFWIILLRRGTFDSSFFLDKVKLCLIISLFDAAGSISFLSANSFLNFPRLAIISTFTTPAVMILSIVFLGAKYLWNNWLGAIFTVIGVISLYITQILSMPEPGDDVSNATFGYFLAIVSALSYGVSNVTMEYTVKLNNDTKDISYPLKTTEILSPVNSNIDSEIVPPQQDIEPMFSMTSILAVNSSFSAIWSLIYFLSWGMRKEIAFFSYSGSTPSLLHHWPKVITYLLSLGCFYSLLPVMMKIASAALFNISLLTTTILAILVNFLIFGESLRPELLVPCFLVIMGIIIFNIKTRSNVSDHISNT